MSNSKYHDEVLAYLTQNGATGVNKLSDALDIPLTTMQRFLTAQSYFKKTDTRKWDLPQNVNADISSNTMTLMVDSVENSLKLLQSQIAEISLSLDNSLVPLNTLKRGINTILAPVATKTGQIDPIFVELDKKVKDMNVLYKSYVPKVPEEYQELLANADFAKLISEKGTEFLYGPFGTELSGLMLQKATELTLDALEILKTYQKLD